MQICTTGLVTLGVPCSTWVTINRAFGCIELSLPSWPFYHLFPVATGCSRVWRFDRLECFCMCNPKSIVAYESGFSTYQPTHICQFYLVFRSHPHYCFFHVGKWKRSSRWKPFLCNHTKINTGSCIIFFPICKVEQAVGPVKNLSERPLIATIGWHCNLNVNLGDHNQWCWLLKHWPRSMLDLLRIQSQSHPAKEFEGHWTCQHLGEQRCLFRNWSWVSHHIIVSCKGAASMAHMGISQNDNARKYYQI